MRMLLDLVVETAVDRMPRFMEISECDPVSKWDFQEPGARFETLERSVFGDTTPVLL